MIIQDLFESSDTHSRLLEYSMSEMATFLDDLKTLQTANADFDPDTATVYLRFVLHGQPGTLQLRSRPNNGKDAVKTFRARLYAAAIAMLNGHAPKTWEEVIAAVKGRIRPMAIRILTNPLNWQIIGMDYDGIKLHEDTNPVSPERAEMMRLYAQLPFSYKTAKGDTAYRVHPQWLDKKSEQEIPEIIGYFKTTLEYLKAHPKAVRDDGLVEFWRLSDEIYRLIDDLPVALFHFTSNKVVPKIKQEGLTAGNQSVNHTTTHGVYLTTETSGKAVEGYSRNARQAHGGYPVRVTVKAYLSELEADPDDYDITSGEHQFMVDHVAPDRIIKIERASL